MKKKKKKKNYKKRLHNNHMYLIFMFRITKILEMLELMF